MTVKGDNYSQIMLFISIFVLIIICGFVLSFIKKRNMVIKDIKSLYFSYSDGYAYEANYIYDIKCDNKCTVTIKNWGETIENAKMYDVNKDDMKKIEDILNKYHVGSWDGFSKSDKNVLDGDSFDFRLKLKNGNDISASGYMRWPRNYKNVKKELIDVFNHLTQ